MTYGVVHQFKGGTKDQYEASIAAVHPADGSLPAGQMFHAAGPSADGWTIVAMHDSKESWETFRDSTLMPRMQARHPRRVHRTPAGDCVRGGQRGHGPCHFLIPLPAASAHPVDIAAVSGGRCGPPRPSVARCRWRRRAARSAA